MGDLISPGKSNYVSPDKRTRLLCKISKEYQVSGRSRYWYAFHRKQKDYLEGKEKSFISLGCGNESQTLLIPFDVFAKVLKKMKNTEKGNTFYWHVEVYKTKDRYYLFKPNTDGLDVTSFLLPPPKK